MRSMTASLGIAFALVATGCGDDGSPGANETTAPTSGNQPSSGAAVADSSTAADSTGDGSPSCAPDTASNLTLCVDRERIEQDVSFMADIRTPGSVHWQAVQELCSDRLTMLGFEVELQTYATGTNVIGRLPGTDNPQEVVLIGAHYDHIPDCLGADDNATGVAGALEAARVLAQAPDRSRTLAIACWDEEELGLVGSTAWVEAGQAPGETVVAYLNYDMIGFASDEPNTQSIPPGFDAIFPPQYMQVEANEFRGDFILTVADDLALAPTEAFEFHADRVGLVPITAVLDAASKNSELFADLRRSDHAPFWLADIPAIFLTDTGEFRNDAYHCIGGPDTIESLDFDFAERVVAATVGSAAETLGVTR